MGVVCDCNLNTSRPIVFKKQEIAIDITNNNTEIENKISEFTKLKLYFQALIKILSRGLPREAFPKMPPERPGKGTPGDYFVNLPNKYSAAKL